MRRSTLALLALLAGCGSADQRQAAQAAPQPPAGPASAAVAAAADLPPPDGPRLAFPLACRIGADCEVQNYYDRDDGPGVQDYRCGRRGYDGHDGIDIRVADRAAEARGVDVLAAAPGRVARLRDGVEDNGVKTAGQECGNGVVIDHGNGWETQYCHLKRGSVRVAVGQPVASGDPIAQVGYSGNTEFPHLHIGVRHNGRMLDPFAPGAMPLGTCTPQAPLWTPEAARQLAYKAGAILKVGVAGSAVTQEEIDDGRVAAPAAGAPVLAAYVRAIGLEAGDRLELTLRSPRGEVLATNVLPPLDRDKAQYFLMVGKRRPAQGWPAGAYQASARILRGEAVAAERAADTTL
ncbi:M23 family metallopeptidase [Phenylobacterium sp.]|uniref:M23 family metallopeptidase n=1 Tax=Phenylobacterium sp. TaxID=1871053 RepID=UPI0035B3DF21